MDMLRSPMNHMKVSPSPLNPMFFGHIDGDYREVVHEQSKTNAPQQDIDISSTSIHCGGTHQDGSPTSNAQYDNHGYLHKVSHNAYDNYMVKHSSGHHDQPLVWHNRHPNYMRGSRHRPTRRNPLLPFKCVKLLESMSNKDLIDYKQIQDTCGFSHDKKMSLCINHMQSNFQKLTNEKSNSSRLIKIVHKVILLRN